MNPCAFVVALVGAESTGKTTLAQALAAQLRAHGHRVAWVPEVLRAWCDAAGRTPRADEQRGIAETQHARIAAAARTHELVVSDTTALMTAVYSEQVFGDRSLHAQAAALHRRDVHLTLLTALDLPWVPDGLQRDGPQVRVPVDDTLRHLMAAEGIDFSIVSGEGGARLARALSALPPRWRPEAADGPARKTDLETDLETGLKTGLDSGRPRARGLFSGLEATTPDGNEPPRRWACECCVPEYEKALFDAAAPGAGGRSGRGVLQ